MSESSAGEDVGEAQTQEAGPSVASAPTSRGDAGRASSALPRGAAVGRYLVLSLLGRGGMGAVYAAYDPELDRRVALKLLHTAGGYENAAKLLAREARVLGQLSHPNVVQVHDVGEHEGSVFVAMELVEGEALDAWCRRAPGPGWEAVLAAYVDAARGLSAAHAKGVVHRDVKPANILRGRDGRVRVVDFGIAVGLASGAVEAVPAVGGVMAEVTGGSASERLTEAGVVMGTPLYMAPEQLQPEAVSPASDQFALCASLYEGLYGVPPAALDRSLPSVQAMVDLFARKRAGPPAAPPAGTRVPPWIHKALARGLAPRPEDRYPSMDALVAALSRDPDAPRRAFWRMAGVGAAAGALLAIAVAGWERGALSSPCAHPELHLAGVWDEGVKARVRAAFAGTGRADAEGTTARVIALLDQQAKAYASMRGEVCEAARSAKQRPEILDLREACLSRRRGQLQALADLLAERSDAQVLDKAVAAAAGLHPVAYCADIDALTARVRPPEDPSLRARVAALEPRVDRLETLWATGKYREGLSLAEPLLVETAAVPYPPLHAQAQFWTGRLREASGEFEAARATLRDAALSAAEGGDDVLVAHAWARILFVAAERQQRFEEAALIRSLGAVAVARAHDERIRATWLNAEGLLLWRTGKSADAKATFEAALALREKVMGKDHPDVANSLNNLGLVLQDLGAFQESAATQERGLAIREKVLGKDHPDVSLSLNNLGLVRYEMGDYTRAVAAQERALAIRERALGPDHPDVAQSLDNLAIALFKLGDLQRALAADERALAIDEKALGPVHPHLAQVLTNMGDQLAAMGDYSRAVESYERSRAMFEKTSGPESRPLANVLGNLGNALHEAGDDARAKVDHERALAILEKTIGPGHSDVAYPLTGLGRAEVRLGHLDLARTSLGRALSLREKSLGPSHPALAETLLGLAELSLAQHHPDQALPLLDRALSLADAEEKPSILRALSDTTWRIGKDRPRARALAEEARTLYERAGHRPGAAFMIRWLAEHRAR